jgi:anaerobic magnesium-protoporphyrin IX monomethyl ester cyclase
MRIFFTRPDSQIPAAPVPLGMMSLAAFVRQHRHSDELRLWDARVHMTPNSQLIPLIAEFNPDILCITSFSLEADLAHDLVAQVKKALPKCRIFLGGPYPTSDTNTAIQDQNIDLAFIGEGETSFLAVLNALDAGAPLDGIKGIAYRKDGEIINTGYPDMINDLDELPMPAWDLIDLDFYFSRKGKRAMMNKLQRSPKGVSIFTTRGCPYRCSYCHNVFGKKLRKRSPEKVVAELKLLQTKYGVQELEFLDDIFNLDMDRAMAIFDGMEQEGLRFNITFPNGLRAEYLSDELLDRFKRGGVYWITVAIESGSPLIQKAIHKNVDLAKAQENINKISRMGISCNGFFMLGFLGETEEQILQTIDFALKSRLVIASFFILTPFPNTEIYHEAILAGIDMNARYSDYHDVSVNLSKVSTERLWKLKRMAYRKFYFSPKRMYLILRANPFTVGLWDGVWYLLKMAFTGRELKKAASPEPSTAGAAN